MRFGQLLVALVAAALAFSGIGPAPPAPHFQQVRHGMFMLTQWWSMVPGLPRVPVAVYLARQGEGRKWALVDAGLPDSPRQPHATQLLAAVKAALPEGDELAVIVLTHAHPDHIGGLPLLLAAYPEVPVAMHEGEDAFVVGHDPRQLNPPGSLAATFARWAGALGEEIVKVPASRATVLTEPLASLEQFGLPDLTYLITLGHSPGHMSLLHQPSRTLIAGDALSFLWPSLGRSNDSADASDTRVIATLKPWPTLPGITLRAHPNVLCLKNSCDQDKATTSSCLLAHAFEFDTLLASHDWALARSGGSGGWSQAHMVSWTAASPACQKLLQMADKIGKEQAAAAAAAAAVGQGQGQGQGQGGRGGEGRDDDQGSGGEVPVGSAMQWTVPEAAAEGEDEYE